MSPEREFLKADAALGAAVVCLCLFWFQGSWLWLPPALAVFTWGWVTLGRVR